MAEGGWLGLAIPEEYGGGGRGITDAAVMLHEIAASGAAMNGCSAVHLTVFGLNPVVKFGNDRLKETFLPRAAAGDLHVAFGVTEPDAGTDTGRITTARRARRQGRLAHPRPQDLDQQGARVRSRAAASCAPATTTAASRASPSSSPTSTPTTSTSGRSRRSAATRSRRARSRTTASRSRAGGSLGEEGEGFRLLLHGLNPERVLLASEACGIGEVALDRAVAYAKDRIVFDRPSAPTRRSATRSRTRTRSCRPRG